ncbi:flagellar type III secretion system protein FlhB [Achromobacter sp. GG226]|uniref:flagellar biosynthesis protein FlhB n=1 Tax=Verticiella alkaliphila TaxID=2779529 RepID=UPI001C0C0D44|nr:flagellar biosynthesis protein FlhB [Verticiella sp. GG226]MBU4610514.1 flagellar type III secretion system protein FlhB [Verticiella sp. GG226]
MADDSDLEKTEPASERRLEKAREEGQTPRSRELVTFMMLLAGVAGLWLGADWIRSGLTQVLHHALAFDARVGFDTRVMLEGAGAQAWHALFTMMPIFGMLALVAIGASVALGGLLFVGKPLQPDLNRLNPIKGLGRIFSANTLIELLKAIAKALLVGTVAFFTLRHFIDEMLSLMQLPTAAALAQSLRLVAICCGVIVASLVLVAGFDAPYQIWSHNKKLRMSKEDVRQEHKESDGDPHLKARIRQQQRQMARGRMMSAVPDADVVVTNPTHFAVALRYEEGKSSAPRVVAKGTGLIAARIRELAAEHRVPLLEAPPLARALYHHVEVEAEIPASLYTAVAEVLAWVFQLRLWRNEGGIEPSRPTALAVPAELDTRMGTA